MGKIFKSCLFMTELGFYGLDGFIEAQMILAHYISACLEPVGFQFSLTL